MPEPLDPPTAVAVAAAGTAPITPFAADDEARGRLEALLDEGVEETLPALDPVSVALVEPRQA